MLLIGFAGLGFPAYRRNGFSFNPKAPPIRAREDDTANPKRGGGLKLTNRLIPNSNSELWRKKSSRATHRGRCPLRSESDPIAARHRNDAKGHLQTHAPQQSEPYSMTSSARASMAAEISTPSSLAALRLRTNRNLVACSTGMSPGFAPLRILSARAAARRNISENLTP
jgi:hypothetical protein